jgi:hypothetical protein
VLSFLRVFPPKLCITFSPLPCVPHAHPTSLLLPCLMTFGYEHQLLRWNPRLRASSQYVTRTCELSYARPPLYVCRIRWCLIPCEVRFNDGLESDIMWPNKLARREENASR